MERPERPRRHKTIVHRQNQRPTTSASPQRPQLIEGAFETDSDGDILHMEVEVNTLSPFRRNLGNIEERPVNRPRPPRLTAHSHVLTDTVHSGLHPIQNKRFRPHIPGPPYNLSIRPAFPISESFAPHSSISQPQAQPSLQELQLQGPTASNTQATLLDINAPIKTDNSTVDDNNTSENGQMDSSCFSRLLDTVPSGSNSTATGSRILQAIDDLCFPPSRPRLTGRRRLHPFRNALRDLENVMNNNPFVARESPISPPVVNAGVVPARFATFTSFGEDHVQMSSDTGNTQTVMSQPVLPDSGNTIETEDQLAVIGTETFNHDMRLIVSGEVQPAEVIIPESPPYNNTLPRSPVLLEPHSPNTSPPLSPISPEYINQQSPFDPTSPLTTPPGSPSHRRPEPVFHYDFQLDSSEEEIIISIPIEHSMHRRRSDIIDLDAPGPSDCPDLVNACERPLHPVWSEAQQSEPSTSADSSNHSNSTPLPSRTPPLERIQNNYPEQVKSERKTTASETLKELNQNLVSLLECPVCLDFMVPPILQCNKGHLVCSACRPKLTVCPTCRSRFAERNLAMEKVAEKLMYPCKNVITGCNVMLKLKDKTKHEQNCGYRHFDCIMGSCEWKGYKPELIVHMSHVHAERLVLGNEKQVTVSYLSGRQSWIFYTFEEVFLLTLSADIPSKKFLGCVQLVGAPEKTSQFLYSLKLERSDPYMASQFWDQMHSDESKPGSIFYANKGLIMDAKDVRRYAMTSNHRRVTVSVMIKSLCE